MVDEFHYPKEPIADPPEDIIIVAEFDSDLYRNLDEVDEYHDKSVEFPTDMGTESEEEPLEEKPSQEQIKNSVNSGTNSGAHSSSSVPPEVMLSTIAVAAIATVAVVIPTIENADTEVDFDVSFVNGILSYYIELYEASENEEYYAYVLENGAIIHQSKINGNQISESLDGLLPYNEYLIEVRSGSPPLYVVSSYFIPASPVWAELDYMSADYNNIEYSVILFGHSGDAEISLYDPEADEVVYSMIMVEGVNSGIISGLVASHLYVLNVTSETAIILSEEIETMAGEVQWDHLIVNGLTVDYGVTVTESEDTLYISMTDSTTSSVLYQRELAEGTTSDVITGLEYNHTYMLTVYSNDWTFLSERIMIEGDPTVVTLGHLKVVDGKSIDYEVTVTGSRDVATAYLTDARTGAVVYTSVLSIGVNSYVIIGLEFNHAYQFKVSSPRETFVQENVTTGPEPTDLALERLEALGSTIEYEIAMTGGQDAPKVYLYESESGTLKYTANLAQGFNTGSITDLEFGIDYMFKVSSETNTYVEQVVFIADRFELSYLYQEELTIEYGVVINDPVNATLSLYAVSSLDDPEPQLIWENEFTENETLVTGVISEDEEEQPITFGTYVLKIVLEDETIVLGSVEVVSGTFDYFAIKNNVIEYSVTYNLSDEPNLIFHDSAYGGSSSEIVLNKGVNTGTVTNFAKYGSEIFGEIHRSVSSGNVTTEPIEVPFPVTVNYLAGGVGKVSYSLWVDPSIIGDENILYIAVPDGTVEPVKQMSIPLVFDTEGNVSGVAFGVEPGDYSEVRLEIGEYRKNLDCTVVVTEPLPDFEITSIIGYNNTVKVIAIVNAETVREAHVLFYDVGGMVADVGLDVNSADSQTGEIVGSYSAPPGTYTVKTLIDMHEESTGMEVTVTTDAPPVEITNLERSSGSIQVTLTSSAGVLAANPTIVVQWTGPDSGQTGNLRGSFSSLTYDYLITGLTPGMYIVKVLVNGEIVDASIKYVIN